MSASAYVHSLALARLNAVEVHIVVHDLAIPKFSSSNCCCFFGQVCKNSFRLCNRYKLPATLPFSCQEILVQLSQKLCSYRPSIVK